MRPSRWVVLAVLCTSLLLVAMDATILNVALPSLIEDLQPDAMEQLWIIDIYGLVLGGLLLTSGAAGDRWGRKRLFLLGIALFGVASAVAATAASTEQLIAGRVLLAVGGAMIMPATLSLIRNVFTDPRERTFAIGVWAAVAGAGAAIGPVLGGFLIEHFHWSAAFWVNVPIVVAALIAGIAILPEFRHPGDAPLSWFDAALSIVGMIALVWGIKELAKYGPLSVAGATATALLLAGAGMLIWFVRRQSRMADPLLDIKLFRNHAFLGAALVILAAMMAIGAALFLISLWLQYVREYSPMEAGIRLLPAAIAMLIAALSASRLIARFGVKAVLVSGLAALSLAFAALALLPLSYPLVAVALIVFGLGDGVAITAATSVMVSAAPPERAGMAAAIEETCYELGVGLGVALLGTVAAAAYRLGVEPLVLVEPNRTLVDESIGGAVHLARDLPEPVAAHLLDVATTAYVHAVELTSGVSAIMLAAAAVGVVKLVPRGFQANTQH